MGADVSVLSELSSEDELELSDEELPHPVRTPAAINETAAKKIVSFFNINTISFCILLSAYFSRMDPGAY